MENIPMPTRSPRLDIEKYIDDFDEFDMTREEKEAYLLALWEITGAFVNIAWGTDPVQTVLTERIKEDLQD